ncbi:MAG: hypothetical protein A2Y90_03705 [Chloroflexi bacterium RBG_13_52_12]|nr:MAG: hypothetical protein A2Y90_03705 [Chloroflexi bacterium RBG_13_52_12]
MKFGSIKLGKSKDKGNSSDDAAEDIAVELLKNTAQGDEPVKPHRPLVELSLDAAASTDLITDEDVDTLPLGAEGDVKLVEVLPEAAAVPVEDKKEASNTADIGASLSSLFQSDEEEENPLANLLKALPDVTATELMDDLKEIKDIIKDWQKK